MAVQLNVLTRNAKLDAIESLNGTSCSLEIRTGTPPANCAAAGTGSVLVTMNLPSDWMLDAANGVKAKAAGAWQDPTADAPGTAGHFRVYNSQATKDGTTCCIQGTCTGGGDMTLDNYVIAAGQVVTITGFTLTEANA